MLNSALKSALPAFDPDELLKLIRALCAVDGPKWLPKPNSTLYIRPTLIGSEPSLGYKVPQKALLFIVMTTWSLPKDDEHLRLVTSGDTEVRAWPGGTGSLKLGANYGLSLLAQDRASKDGADQILWLFGPDKRVTEAGASNFFTIWRTAEGSLQLITSPLDDLILPGVMRQTVLDLVREKLSKGSISSSVENRAIEALSMMEEHFTIHDIVSAADQGRLVAAFVTGTASFITPVVNIRHEGRYISMKSADCLHLTFLKTCMLDIVYGRQESSLVEVIENEGDKA